MIKLNSQYPSRIKYVKKSTSSNGTPMTKFSIGDKVKGSDGQYTNYDVTVFADLPLSDGDEVVFASIDSLESRLYNEKVYHSIVAKLVSSKVAEKAVEDDVILPFDI